MAITRHKGNGGSNDGRVERGRAATSNEWRVASGEREREREREKCVCARVHVHMCV